MSSPLARPSMMIDLTMQANGYWRATEYDDTGYIRRSLWQAEERTPEEAVAKLFQQIREKAFHAAAWGGWS